ncbi:unnamed protein product [Rotaria socialis]|uniref:Uncharacterized protein n=1 Tax=Rotaria socialis TaxID=392032 RepID=A0A818E1J0_9BILA|nr:unnamed protein product [Rotaria socialis]
MSSEDLESERLKRARSSSVNLDEDQNTPNPLNLIKVAPASESTVELNERVQEIVKSDSASSLDCSKAKKTNEKNDLIHSSPTQEVPLEQRIDTLKDQLKQPDQDDLMRRLTDAVKQKVHISDDESKTGNSISILV